MKAVTIAPEIGRLPDVVTIPVSTAFVGVSSPRRCTVGTMMESSASRVTVRWPVKKPLGAKITTRMIIIPNAFVIRFLNAAFKNDSLIVLTIH